MLPRRPIAILEVEDAAPWRAERGQPWAALQMALDPTLPVPSPFYKSPGGGGQLSRGSSLHKSQSLCQADSPVRPLQ